jgi:hypothetical protein
MSRILGGGGWRGGNKQISCLQLHFLDVEQLELFDLRQGGDQSCRVERFV